MEPHRHRVLVLELQHNHTPQKQPVHPDHLLENIHSSGGLPVVKKVVESLLSAQEEPVEGEGTERHQGSGLLLLDTLFAVDLLDFVVVFDCEKGVGEEFYYFVLVVVDLQPVLVVFGHEEFVVEFGCFRDGALLFLEVYALLEHLLVGLLGPVLEQNGWFLVFGGRHQDEYFINKQDNIFRSLYSISHTLNNNYYYCRAIYDNNNKY